MNYAIILKSLSTVLWIMALAFSVCIGVSMYYAENPLEADAIPSWICAVAMSSMAAFALYVPSRNAPKRLFRKEAMCLIGLAWILASVVGAFPYIAILDCSIASALFESTSGITTTGSSVFSDFSNFPPSLMFWRCLSHWIGGLGVVVFFVTILSYLGAAGKMLYSNEASADSGDFEAARIRSGIWNIVKLYLVLSICCFGAFKYFGMPTFDAICHMFSVVATGGFSTQEDSFATYNTEILWTAIVFMFLGGTSFALMLAISKLKFRKLIENTEFWTYVLIIITAVSIIFTVLIYTTNQSISETFTHSVFQVVSIITTTGLSSQNYQIWLPSTQIILLLLTVLGGCSGSTAGGLKISRALTSFRLCKREVEKSFRPRVVRNVFINGKSINKEEANDVLSFFVLYMLIAAISITILALFEPKLSITGNITAILASLSNVGPGFAEVGCNSTYGMLNAFSQMMLAFLMIMGRLEIYAILVLFMPSLWKKFQ